MQFAFKLIVALGVCGIAHGDSAPGAYEGKRILAVQYEPRRQPIDSKDLEKIQVLEPGMPLRYSDAAAAIDRLFATGLYDDIQVDAQLQSDGVIVRFFTMSRFFNGHVELSGKISGPPNRGQILGQAQLSLGAPFDPDAVKAAQDRIKRLLDNNGLYEASVRVDTFKDPDTQLVNIEIHTEPGKRARYDTPEIHGETKLPAATIIRATGWRVRFINRWRKVSDALTQKGIEGIQRKYQSKDRLAAAVDLESLDYDPATRRVKPKLAIDAGPEIEITATESKVSKRILRRYVPVYEEGAVDRDLLVEGARNLRDYFQSKGYSDVDVTFRELPLQNDKQTIEYFVARGPRRKLKQIAIRGNKYFAAGTIRERMFLQPSSFQYRRGRYSEGFRKKDEETIATLYRSNGFRDVKVASSVVADYGGRPAQIGVVFEVEEGPQWFVESLETSGMTPADGPNILGALSEGQGQPFSDLSVASDRNAILTYYSSHGFPKAAFQWSASPGDTGHQVRLYYKVNPGPQEFVRNVLMSGLKTTRVSLVEKNLSVARGDPLSVVAITAAQRVLFDLGIFANIHTAIEDSDGDIPAKNVLYDFEEANRYSMKIGIGAEIGRLGGTTSTLSAAEGHTGFSPRFSLDLSRLNFLGRGDTVSLGTLVSTLEQRASLSYLSRSLGNVRGRDLTITGLYDDNHDVLTFSSKREEASIQLSDKLSKPTSVFFRFAYRRVSTADIVIPALLVPQLLSPVRIGIASVNLVQDRRDDPSDAHHGIYNAVDIGLASKVFGSQRSFGRLLARNSTYTRIGKKLVFARQLTLGAIVPFALTQGLTSADAVPLPERFFAGGDNSLRAFPENQAGPRDIGTPAGPGAMASQPTGFPLGGNALLVTNEELRFPLIGDNIGGVLFHDAGNVYSGLSGISFRFHQRNDQDFNYMVHAVGFGIRYKTPVGPIRGDLAYSINPPNFVGFKGSIQQLLACNPNLPPDQLPANCQGVPQRVSHFQFFFSIGQTF